MLYMKGLSMKVFIQLKGVLYGSDSFLVVIQKGLSFYLWNPRMRRGVEHLSTTKEETKAKRRGQPTKRKDTDQIRFCRAHKKFGGYLDMGQIHLIKRLGKVL